MPEAPQPEDPPAISYDQSSLLTPTGGGAWPPARSAAERCPCPNAGELSHARNAASSRHLVTTSQVVRPSVGLSSSKPSKPSWLSTAPARAANLRASSSPLSAGTVIALILTTVTCFKLSSQVSDTIRRRGCPGHANIPSCKDAARPRPK